jgi:uncharacterized protein YcbX
MDEWISEEAVLNQTDRGRMRRVDMKTKHNFVFADNHVA